MVELVHETRLTILARRRSQAIEGLVVDPSGDRHEFEGWLELLSVVQELLPPIVDHDADDGPKAGWKLR